MIDEITKTEKALLAFPFVFVLFAPIGMTWGIGAGAAYLAVTFLCFTLLAVHFAIKGEI